MDPCNILLVKHLRQETSATVLNDLFSKYGEVMKVKVVASGHQRSLFGIIVMEEVGKALAAMSALNGYKLVDKTMVVGFCPQKLVERLGLGSVMQKKESEVVTEVSQLKNGTNGPSTETEEVAAPDSTATINSTRDSNLNDITKLKEEPSLKECGDRNNKEEDADGGEESQASLKMKDDEVRVNNESVRQNEGEETEDTEEVERKEDELTRNDDEELKRQKEDEEARMKEQDEARMNKEREEKERKKKEEEEIRRREEELKIEEEMRRKKEEELKKKEEELKRKREEELKRKREEELKRKKEEELKKKEEELKRKKEEELRKKKEEELKRKREEELKRKKEEELRRRKEEEELKRKKEEEELRKRREAEELRRRKEEEEERKRALEQRRAEEQKKIEEVAELETEKKSLEAMDITDLDNSSQLSTPKSETKPVRRIQIQRPPPPSSMVISTPKPNADLQEGKKKKKKKLLSPETATPPTPILPMAPDALDEVTPNKKHKKRKKRQSMEESMEEGTAGVKSSESKRVRLGDMCDSSSQTDPQPNIDEIQAQLVNLRKFFNQIQFYVEEGLSAVTRTLDSVNRKHPTT